MEEYISSFIFLQILDFVFFNDCSLTDSSLFTIFSLFDISIINITRNNGYGSIFNIVFESHQSSSWESITFKYCYIRNSNGGDVNVVSD